MTEYAHYSALQWRMTAQTAMAGRSSYPVCSVVLERFLQKSLSAAELTKYYG